MTEEERAQVERETILKVALSIRRYAEKHYPKDVFDPAGRTPDAAAARFARTMCEKLAQELERTANSEDGTG